MIKRSFFGFTTPRIQYLPMPGQVTTPAPLKRPDNVTLLVPCPAGDLDDKLVQIGDHVKSGQKISLTSAPGAYGIASLSGTLSAIDRFPGEAGREYTAVTITAAEAETLDNAFEDRSEPTLENAAAFLACAPGAPSFEPFTEPDKPIHTIIVNGMDQDLLVMTAQYTLAFRMADIQAGIKFLKAVTGVENIVLATPRDAMHGYGEIGASVMTMDATYPSGLPKLIAQKVLEKEIPNGKSFQDMGVCFFTAEAVASIGRAFSDRQIPFEKTITFIDKQGNRSLISARIGTPIADILKEYQVSLEEKDRIIIGGPMTGHSIFSTQYPVQPFTDAILLQDHGDIALTSDYPCINCGDCVRMCPARIQVNLLVRFLEAGFYEEAAEAYDLSACLECGICSYVCVSKIPIFQYIRLAKHELGRVASEETATEEATDE
ncbi:MAG: 4Fe-4S dicluster domain-containing protein [Deltaproteobacteria bacterium]|nr:4Fe-4S dicluster domain-containing protein [Deltaproteobacteria bacterium]